MKEPLPRLSMYAYETGGPTQLNLSPEASYYDIYLRLYPGLVVWQGPSLQPTLQPLTKNCSELWILNPSPGIVTGGRHVAHELSHKILVQGCLLV